MRCSREIRCPEGRFARCSAWLGAACATLLLMVPLAACGLEAGGRSARDMAALAGGDPELGKSLIQEHGCGACHTIAGIVGADRRVGPPLVGLAERMYVAGVLPNTPDNLATWISDPTSVDPLTAMPDVGVTLAQARHIAAYLYTLE